MQSLLRLFFVSTFSLALLGAFAQDADDPNDMQSKVQKINSNQDRLVVELYFDNLIKGNGQDSLEFKWFSRGVSVNFLYDIQFGSSPLSFAAGIGIGNHNYYSDREPVRGDIILGGDTVVGTRMMMVDETGRTLKKNKISITYFDIPIEFRFRSKTANGKNGFKFALGFKAGFKIDSHTKQKFTIEGEKKIFKEKNIIDLSTFRFGPTFRIGYGVVNVVAHYGLQSIFKDGSGPELNPFYVGISFNGL